MKRERLLKIYSKTKQNLRLVPFFFFVFLKKVLTSRLVSVEEDLTNLRHDSGHLSIMCKGNDRVLIATLVSTLWLKWLRLLEAAKEWEIKCEEQSQEWKSVSEEVSSSDFSLSVCLTIHTYIHKYEKTTWERRYRMISYHAQMTFLDFRTCLSL